MPALVTKNKRGFTMIETVSSMIVIVAILATIVVPRFFDRSAFDERGFYDEVLSAARFAQKLAFTSGCEVQLSASGNTYVLNQRATNCTTGAFTKGVPHPSNRSGTFSGSAPVGITLSMTNSPVVFKATGSTADLTDRTVTVGTRSFQIIGATGFASAP